MTDLEKARRFEAELRTMERAWHAGVEDALADALEWCRAHGQLPPRWVADGVRALVTGQERRTPGRLGNKRSRRRQDIIHYTRWDAVRELIDRAGDRNIPTTWEGRYAAVSELFEGTEAEGGEEAVKRSYQLVQRQMKAGDGAHYYVADQKLG